MVFHLQKKQKNFILCLVANILCAIWFAYDFLKGNSYVFSLVIWMVILILCIHVIMDYYGFIVKIDQHFIVFRKWAPKTFEKSEIKRIELDSYGLINFGFIITLKNGKVKRVSAGYFFSKKECLEAQKAIDNWLKNNPF